MMGFLRTIGRGIKRFGRGIGHVGRAILEFLHVISETLKVGKAIRGIASLFD